MKKFLFGVSLLSLLSVAHAAEHRLYAVDRMGAKVNWDNKTRKFPLATEMTQQGGSLVIAQTKAVESLNPGSNQVADSLYYESLLLPDPFQSSEQFFPLIARSIRINDDLSVVTFELNPEARFQDGQQVSALDVLYSIQEFKKSSSANLLKFEDVVQSVQAETGAVRFELKTTDQASRHAIVWLGSAIKIVKPNVTNVPVAGGLNIPYTTTGPYRLVAVGLLRLSLVKDSYYWGANTPSRRGFFNLQTVEVKVFADESAARSALLGGRANFFLEPQLMNAPILATELLKANPLVLPQSEKLGDRAKKSALVFNIHRPNVENANVRRALMLAYDFDRVNGSFSGGQLQRPLHIGQGSPINPIAMPSAEVAKLMASCDLPDEGYKDFTSLGHAQYSAFADHRQRLMAAQKLLFDAGFKFENGVMKRPSANGQLIPVRLKALVNESDLRSMQVFKSDLARLGIELEIGRKSSQNSDFDMIAAKLEFVGLDGWPHVEKLKLTESQRIPCLQKLIDQIHREPPYSEAYRESVEAFIRISEALQLAIFTGQAKAQPYFVDHRLRVSTGASLSNAYMYGWWLDDSERGQNFIHHAPSHHNCFDPSCLFGFPNGR